MIPGEGQGVVSRRQHAGLQHLASFAEAGRTFLGPVKSPKFITDGQGQESVLVTSAARLLEGLDLSGAAGQLLREAVLAHSNAYGTGVSTLLFLVGAWSAGAEECLHLGVPVPVIAAVMEEGLRVCTDEAGSLQASLDQVSTLLDSTQTLSSLDTHSASLCPCVPSAPGPAAHSLALPRLPRTRVQSPSLTRWQTEPQRSLSGAPRGRLPTGHRSRELALACSRHFCGAGGGEWARQPQGAGGCSAAVELGLSHGDAGSMRLAAAAARLLGQSSPAPRDGPQACALDLTRVVTCCLPGLPEAASLVCAGYVAVVPVASATVARDLQARPLQVLLLEGDLTESYRHPGFRPPANVSTVLGSVWGWPAGTEKPWADRVLQALAQLCVDLVLVQGLVPEHLAERCARGQRLVLGSVAGCVLQAFAEASRARPVAYLSQVDGDCVGSGVRVAPWHSGTVGVAAEAGAAVTLQAEGLRLVTAVLTSPLATQGQSRADRFWACACRLHHALREQRVFLGGGALELWCLRRLQALAGQGSGGAPTAPGGLLGGGSWLASSLAHYRPAVLGRLARGWHRYLCVLLCNTARCASELEADSLVQRLLQDAVGPCWPPARAWGGRSEPGTCALGEAPAVLDAVTPKLEAWRRALDLVLLVLQTDSEVVTGPGCMPAGPPGPEDPLLL
ncbi:Bardet-Biedl syndrome 12 protein [Galemys pyrenaicus]|uniref:Bardet-Biedl syndrome 12 protein n=1 Tax=Galemys pyrenaicus TaxID=202257 RepID=A0A8J5ZZT1_GALPY|nr:Bardet-Biedl syndrome 12 protein [Galemys pyrenaicus]